MKGHPGGREHTLYMLALSELRSGRVIDLGAGAGESVELLQGLGFEAVGIDISPRRENVQRGDLLALDYPDGCFDAAMSQCSFFVSGDISGAISEAARVLKKGGILMLSDVCFENIEPIIKNAGFVINYAEDMTAQWREYYFEALWRGDELCCNYRGRCRYMLYICRKE